MERHKEKRRRDEVYMDWQIASAKAVVCLRKFKETHHEYWLHLVENHITSANSFLQEMDRRLELIADPVDYVGADRLPDEPTPMLDHIGFAVPCGV